MGWAEERPVASEEVAEERALGDNEEQTNDRCDDVTCGIKKEKLIHIRYEHS